MAKKLQNTVNNIKQSWHVILECVFTGWENKHQQQQEWFYNNMCPLYKKKIRNKYVNLKANLNVKNAMCL